MLNEGVSRELEVYIILSIQTNDEFERLALSQIIPHIS